jgi:hypothetical protein|tara:strand:+ start:1124 stop:1555 length:432 start_codon:yes stop_codon:yes gene_type:complete
MANVVPDSFKTDLLKGKFSFDTSGNSGSTFYLALYTSSASFSTSTSSYSNSNEVSGTGYSAGGQALTNLGVAISSNIAFVDFSDETWTSATITARYGLIYKNSSNEAVLVLDFGGDKTSTNGDFTVAFPAATNSAAIIRLGDA